MDPRASFTLTAEPEIVVQVTEQPDGRWTVVTETKRQRVTYKGVPMAASVGDEVDGTVPCVMRCIQIHAVYDPWNGEGND